MERREFLKLTPFMIAAAFEWPSKVASASDGITQLSSPDLNPLQEVSNLPIAIPSAETSELLLPENLNCPIHYWHEVSSQNAFENYLYSVIASESQPVTMADIAKYFESGLQTWPVDKKPMVITIDDGLLSAYRNAFPVLKKWNVAATFAVMPDYEGDGSKEHIYMTNEHYKEIAQCCEIASHTFNHPKNLPELRTLNRGDWERQIIRSKWRLEEITGKSVVSFIYPYGRSDIETQKLVSQLYKIAVKTGGTSQLSRTELYNFPRQSRS